MERAIKWMPKPEIDFACADISFSWVSEKDARLVVLMHFSRIVGGFSKDLEIVFDSPFAVKWESESFGLIDSPGVLPRCSGAKFHIYTHPTLVVKHSKWAAQYAANRYAKSDPAQNKVVHYFMLSLNDLLHVLAESEPEASWVLSEP